MKLTKRQGAILELRSWQRFHESNPDYLDWDGDEQVKHNRKLITAMRLCGLDAGDAIDAQAWIVSGDGYRTCESLGRELSVAAPDAIAERLKSLESTIQKVLNAETRTSRDSAKKLGREPGKTKLSKFELDAIKQYCDGTKPAEIDATMSNKSGAVRGMGKDKKEWDGGDTDHVIRAAKRRGAIRKNENGWEIVTN